MSTLGEKIKRLRELKDLTQKELADASKITEAALSRYENGLREPRLDILSRIAAALDTNVEYMVSTSSSKDNSSNEFDMGQYDEFMSKANAFFMNDHIPEEDKEAFFRDVSELFWLSKGMNKKDNSKKNEKS